MSSIAWSTAVVLLLLTPGLFALLGMYLPLRVSRDVVPQTGLSQLAYLICASAALHAPALLITRFLSVHRLIPAVDLAEIFAILDLGLARNMSALDLAGDIYGNIGLISLYFLGTGIAGLALGYLIGRMIISGQLRSLAQHGWVYELQSAEKVGFTWAYVLTTVQEGSRVLMYKGLLDQVHIAPDGAISYLTILNSSRFYLILESDAPLTTADDLHRLVGASSSNDLPQQPTRQFLFIKGAEIANVVFVSYGYESDQHGLQLLDEEIRSISQESA